MVTSGRRYGFGIIGCGVIAPTHVGAAVYESARTSRPVRPAAPRKARS